MKIAFTLSKWGMSKLFPLGGSSTVPVQSTATLAVAPVSCAVRALRRGNRITFSLICREGAGVWDSLRHVFFFKWSPGRC